MSANLVFGQVLHQALAQLFKTGENPESFFAKLWKEACKFELGYSRRGS